MLGTDVCRAAGAAGIEVLAYDRAGLDICDRDAVDAVVRRARPDVVVNCAAWTDVDGAESSPDAALAANGAGAGNVARACERVGARILQISSDYVFDGSKSSPYLESDPVRPLSVYGETKLEGERAVAREAPERHTIVRTSWLFGTTGRCFPKTILRLAAEREQLTVVADQVGCPTFTGHLAGALVRHLEAAPMPGLVHVAASEQCSWCEFAREIVEMAGIDCRIEPASTDEMARPAPRPAFSVLRSERRAAPVLAPWREGLREFISSRVTTP
jgi:dTDP-4-dehydrorhamnose reductase